MKDNVIDHNDIPSIINIIMNTIYHINDVSHNINNDGIKQIILLEKNIKLKLLLVLKCCSCSKV